MESLTHFEVGKTYMARWMNGDMYDMLTFLREEDGCSIFDSLIHIGEYKLHETQLRYFYIKRCSHCLKLAYDL